MKRYIRMITPGLVTALAAASAVFGLSLPSYASDSGSMSPIQLVANRNYRNGYNSPMQGTISRVDRGERAFRLYMNNGQSYHVNAGNAAIMVNGAPTSFSNLPTDGTATVIGSMDNNGNINATEVDFGTGYGNNGYYNPNGYGNNGYHNPNGYGNNGYNNPNGYGNNGYNNPNGYGNNGYRNPNGYNNGQRPGDRDSDQWRYRRDRNSDQNNQRGTDQWRYRRDRNSDQYNQGNNGQWRNHRDPDHDGN